MKLLELLRSDDRAVSPVLGVALLIAMTVILAGVVGYVALGVDAKNANAPQGNLDFTQTTNGTAEDVILVHDGGDRIQADELSVKVTDNPGGTATIAADDLTEGADPDPITTGDETRVALDGESGDTVKVIWNDPSSKREVLLAEYTVE